MEKGVYARAGKLQCDSWFFEAKPSTRTKGFAPQEVFCDKLTGDNGTPFLMNCVSRTRGLSERVGGDPQKDS